MADESLILCRPVSLHGVIIAPSVAGDGKWRMTKFDERGFYGHEEFGSEAAALREAKARQFSRVMRPYEFEALSQTPKFRAGMELTEFVARENAGHERTEADQERIDELNAIIAQEPTCLTGPGAEAMAKEIEASLIQRWCRIDRPDQVLKEDAFHDVNWLLFQLERERAARKRQDALLAAYRAKRAADGGGAFVRKWDAMRHYDADKLIEELERVDAEYTGAVTRPQDETHNLMTQVQTLPPPPIDKEG